MNFFHARLKRSKRIGKNLLALLFGLILALLLLEIFLRIYDPFQFSVSGNRINLLSNYSTTFHPGNKKLKPNVQFSKNKLGFRGEEWPGDAAQRFKVLTIGGSTTECKFLSDDSTWSELLKDKMKEKWPSVWLNNAGLDGHSTLGHIILLNDHVLPMNPDCIIFLTGINDIEIEDYLLLERHTIKKVDYSSFRNFYLTICNYSKVGSLVLNLYRYRLSRKRGINYNLGDWKPVVKEIQLEERKKRLDRQEKFLASYKARLYSIISLCKSKGVRPVFLTQPYLGGDAVDPTTGIALSNLEAGEFNTASEWEVLEKYNDVVRGLGADAILVIDLARQMPKDSKYFYDLVHYTEAGANKVSEIVYQALKDSY